MAEQAPYQNATNLIHLFENAVRAYGDADCFVFKDKLKKAWVTWDWHEVRTRVRSLSAGLQNLGLEAGDRVAVLSATRPEWTLADLAILSVGGITVPIYQSNLAEEVAYVLNHSEAKGVFVENAAQLKKVLSIRDQLTSLKFIIIMQDLETKRTSTDEDVILLQTLLDTDPEKATAYDDNLRTLTHESVASYVYTSGTTGQPKGAVLTHGNFLAEVIADLDVLVAQPGDTCLVFLPYAHILGRAVNQFYQISMGYRNAFAESIDQLAHNMQEIKPDFMVSVPRIFEKVYERILSQVHASSLLKQSLFNWARRVGLEYSRVKQRHEHPSVALSLQYFLAHRLVFSKIAQRLGGRMRFAISGGAPLTKEIAEFFHAVGVAILEGYGLTETCAAINCVSLNRVEFGTVGPPLGGVEEKIAEDGEILVRGPLVFKGYYKNDAATREVLDADGWFHTGDIGEFTPSGSLRITDRKKDIIVTAGGKNIAPQKIEGLLKSDKYISQVLVHGDKRKYLTALITLNQEEIENFAAKEGFSVNGNRLMQHPKVYQLVEKIIAAQNQKLASFEGIKRFAILDNDFTQENGELTPSLKLKRRFVSEKYADILNSLYQ